MDSKHILRFLSSVWLLSQIRMHVEPTCLRAEDGRREFRNPEDALWMWLKMKYVKTPEFRQRRRYHHKVLSVLAMTSMKDVFPFFLTSFCFAIIERWVVVFFYDLRPLWELGSQLHNQNIYPNCIISIISVRTSFQVLRATLTLGRGP